MRPRRIHALPRFSSARVTHSVVSPARTESSLAALLYAVERLRSVVRAGDLDAFRLLMTRGKDYLASRAATEAR